MLIHSSLWRDLRYAYAPFLGNTGQTIVDYSGNHNHGSPMSGNTLAWTDTTYGPALDFNGTSTGVCAGTTRNTFGGGFPGMTIAIGCRHTTAAANDYLFMKGESGKEEFTCLTGQSGGTRYFFTVNDVSGALSESINTNQDNVGGAYLVGTSYTNLVFRFQTYMDIWIQGAKRAEDTTLLFSAADIDDNSGRMVFGATNTGAQDWVGQIHYVFGWGRVLTEHEIKLLHATDGHALFARTPKIILPAAAGGGSIPIFAHHYNHNIGVNA